jgi:hypothetical protein
MRTEINHEYKWGFLLSEQELRRIAQSCQEHATKIGAGASTTYSAKLKDGSLIESSTLDDILSLENGSTKAITYLTLLCTDGLEPAETHLAVQFEDCMRNTKTWDSITVSVVGESRDAVFVAAADLDERVKKTRTRAWPYYVSQQWIMIIPMLIGIALMLTALDYFSMTGYAGYAVEELQKEYAAGRVNNPIEALIFFERLKASRPLSLVLMASLVPFAVPFLAFGLAALLIPKISLSYVFYWGDAIAQYDKRRNAYKIFWTIVVLGVVASLVAGLILRVF